MKTELFVCCVEMLRILLDQYDSGKMDAEALKKHAQLKIEFIREHLEIEYAIENKEAVNQLLQKYNNIINENLVI
ncbi:MAG: hypothetical protein K0R31_580 [Clostridiales bacterium]|jgi:hypothetical protein|nr:hypothetical protein [Clostridiales bacterium]